MGIPVLNYPMYEVNEDGTIFSKYTMKTLKTSVTKYGYHTVELFNENGGRRLSVHRLVAEAFIPNPKNYPQVNHKDENKNNNSVDNLEWCTPKYNMNYGKMGQLRHSLINYSKPIYKEIAKKMIEKNKKSVVQMLNGEIIAVFESGKDASDKTKINHSHILEVCGGKRKTAGGYVWQYRREG